MVLSLLTLYFHLNNFKPKILQVYYQYLTVNYVNRIKRLKRQHFLLSPLSIGAA